MNGLNRQLLRDFKFSLNVLLAAGLLLSSSLFRGICKYFDSTWVSSKKLVFLDDDCTGCSDVLGSGRQTSRKEIRIPGKPVKM